MNIDDLIPGSIVEFVHPISKKPESGTYGTGKFIKLIQRRNGGRRLDIELENNLGDKTIIQSENIRWERTKYYNMKEWERKNWDSIQDRRRVYDDEPLSGRA